MIISCHFYEKQQVVTTHFIKKAGTKAMVQLMMVLSTTQ